MRLEFSLQTADIQCVNPVIEPWPVELSRVFSFSIQNQIYNYMKYWSKPQKTMRLALSSAFLLLNSFCPIFAQAIQESTNDGPTLEQATLENVVQYAIKNQPVIQQSMIDERITENQIRSKLADWYPQVNFNYNL